MWFFKKSTKVKKEVVKTFRISNEDFWDMIYEKYKDQIPEKHTSLQAHRLSHAGFGVYEVDVLLESQELEKSDVL